MTALARVQGERRTLRPMPPERHREPSLSPFPEQTAYELDPDPRSWDRPLLTVAGLVAVGVAVVILIVWLG